MAPRTGTLLASLALVAPAAASIPLGCFLEGWVKPTGYNISMVENDTACQALCAANSTCEVFGYYTVSQQCWLGENASEPYVESAVPVVSGPPVCEEATNACNLASVAPAAWPGTTPESSMALWPGGFQPQKLQCLPSNCWMDSEPTVLEDVATGWADKCMGMTEFTHLLGAGETCESSCKNNQSCPAYQVGLDGTCWQGIGFNCSVNPAWNTSFEPAAGKRYKRAEVRVLRNLVDVQIMDLMQVFGPAEISARGEEGAKQECRNICASILNCEYWQLSRTSGCYLEGPTDPVIYPLSNGYAGLHYTTNLAEQMIAGEYIQRYCPAPTTSAAPGGDGNVVEPIAVTETTTAAPESISSLGIFGIIVAALALIACCVGAFFALGLCGKRETKSRAVKKKRAVQPLVPNAAPAGGTSLFDRIDANHDGVITKEEFMRSVQVVPMGGAAPAQQPLPTVSMPMATYQVAAPAPMAAQPVTYAAPPAAVAAPVTYTTTAAPAAMAAPMAPVAGSVVATPAVMPMATGMVQQTPVATGMVQQTPVATGMVQQAAMPVGMVQQPQYAYGTQMAPAEPAQFPGM